MKSIRAIFRAGSNILRQISWPKKIALAIVLMVIFSAVAIEVTSQPSFCNSCHIMNSSYDSWQVSTHAEVNCLDCHLQPGFAGYVKGKINGLAQAVDCIVGRVGTKPNATIIDSSCLRAECHSTEELAQNSIDYKGTKFAHQNHVAKVVGGIEMSCGTCHSHFEGNEHFGVDSGVCFSCHFLANGRDGKKLVQTDCRDCHEVPNRVIERGLVSINHAEFVSYEASCSESCHKKQVEKQSDVADSVCLNCHSFRKEIEANSVELHSLHTSGEKVECFACHGKVPHGAMEGTAVAAMIDCTGCHSDTHEVQRTIYAAQYHSQEKQQERILSPMFLTHVECTGCHIERVAKQSGTLDSFGTVAKAVPRACDNCHEQGTGQRYIRFWQGKVRQLYQDVSEKVDGLEELARIETDQQSKEQLHAKIEQARLILESVASDGSWGVHNFKYTEAMLLKARTIVTGENRH
ncbi:MAG: NapC/NirT family cytochrome c [Planctomycetota bacterium]